MVLPLPSKKSTKSSSSSSNNNNKTRTPPISPVKKPKPKAVSLSPRKQAKAKITAPLSVPPTVFNHEKKVRSWGGLPRPAVLVGLLLPASFVLYASQVVPLLFFSPLSSSSSLRALVQQQSDNTQKRRGNFSLLINHENNVNHTSNYQNNNNDRNSNTPLRRQYQQQHRMVPPFAAAAESAVPNGTISNFGNDNMNSNQHPSSSSSPPIKIAHVVSLIFCNRPDRMKGFLDALMILRHSIHENSIHASESLQQRPNRPRSKYSYQMYAIIHSTGCLEKHPELADHVKRLGYIPLIRDTPVNISDITTNPWYKKNVQKENCCGPAEFIKLYAYTLTDHPIVVHWDLDVAVLQPMDDLFDAMLYDKSHPIGQTARRNLLSKQHVQRGHYYSNHTDDDKNNDQQRSAATLSKQRELPDVIDAFLTRDVTSSKPWESVQAVQGGFLVARPNVQHLETFQQFILAANYTPGRGEGSGWGGLGYGGFQGAMAYQGVLAFFYDQLYPGHHVELDVCRWNQVVADVIWRGPDGPEYIHQCRDYPRFQKVQTTNNGAEAVAASERSLVASTTTTTAAVTTTLFENNTPEKGECHDCRILPVEETMTVHFSACKKPWECRMPYPRVPKDKKQVYRLQELTNVTTCGLLFRTYFEFRHDLEQKISAVAAAEPATNPLADRMDNFHPEYFMGYCKGNHNRVTAGEYISMPQLPVEFDFKQVYGF